MCQRSTNRIFGELLCLIREVLAHQVYQGGNRLGIQADNPMNNTDENHAQILPK